jgi:2,4-dienoyl-CoA reductase-like NADH-dependent reductase (Old Yellow Enzyme family)
MTDSTLAHPATTSPLFTPFRFANGIVAKNRIWLAPMTNLQSHPDGSLSDDELNWLLRRAAGGFGVIETCASHVAEEGQSWQGQLGIASDSHVPGLRTLATKLKAHGAIGLAQLFHGGVRASPEVTGLPAWSASAVEDAGLVPRAASREDILGVIGRFRGAALRARAAGLDGVELHGAHGYLFGQFLSVFNNRRTDEWGGAFENRARLLRETVRAIRAAVPSRFIVGVRICTEDWGQAKGLDLDESVQLGQWLADDGVDYLHLSQAVANSHTKKRPECHVLTLFRAAVPPNVPLVVAGQIWTRQEAELLLEKGASGVALGLSAIANPDWPRVAARAGWEPRRPPFTIDELVARGLSPRFAQYMSEWWKGFVVEQE